MKKNSVSTIALVICYIVILYEGVIFYPKWKNTGTDATISWDVSGHYMYLPAIFIYHDIKHCAFKDKILSTYHPTPDFQQAVKDSSGNYVMKYSSGQAIMLSPFFFIAHIITKATGSYPADGFSFYYQLCIGLGALFYSLLSLWLLRKLLLLYFTDVAVAVTLLVIVVASNYLNYAAIDSAMIHNTLFTLYCALLLATISFYNKPSFVKALLIGGLCGLATITRSSEIITLLIPLLFGVGSLTDLKERLSFFRKYLSYLFAMLAGLLVLVSVQPVYWKYVSGHWVYSNSGEPFDWAQTHFYDLLLSYKSGWLAYSPAMVFALIGFVFLYRNHRKLFFTAIIFTILFIYFNFGSSEWWSVSGIGQRCMVQCYALLAFPLAELFENVYRKRIAAFIITPILLILGYYNLWLTYEARRGGLLHPEETTGEYFWATVGRFNIDARTPELLDNPDLFTGQPSHFSIIYANDFEKDSSANASTVNAIEGKSIFIDKEHPFSKTYSFPLPAHLPKWMRVSADYRLTKKEWETWKMPQVVVKIYEGQWVVQTSYIRINRLIPADNGMMNISLDIKLPETILNHAEVYFWNAESDKKVIIDNLKVIGFDN